MEAAIGASLIGSGLAAYGQYEAGKTQKKAARENLGLARVEAKTTRDSAVEDERIIRDQGRRTLGAFRARQGASGFAANDASFIDVANDLMRQVETDVANNNFNKENEARSKEIAGLIGLRQGIVAEKAGQIGAVSTLLTGGATAYTAYTRGRIASQLSLGPGSAVVTPSSTPATP